jgi:hypothetical protein
LQLLLYPFAHLANDIGQLICLIVRTHSLPPCAPSLLFL